MQKLRLTERSKRITRWIVFLVLVVSTLTTLTCETLTAQSNDALLSVFSNSGASTSGNFNFSQTNNLDLSGSNWGFGLDENDVYHAALKHDQSSGPADREWEIRIGKGGQIYSIQSEVGEIVPPQSLSRPYTDEVFQAVSVDTRPRATGGQAAFYHQAGYLSDGSSVAQPTFSPMLVSGSVDANSYSTLSLAVQADATSNPQQPSGLLNYQRTKDLGDGVIEITHSIYNFGQDKVNFHNLPWGGVRKTKFDNMLVSSPGGGFADRAIDDFGNFQNQVEFAEDTGGWAAFTEGINGTDRGLAYVFGDTDTHLNETWQTNRSSWRWGDGGGDILGFPVRNFNVGTFRREVDVDPGDLFESRYFLVLGDVDHFESTIAFRDLVENATYDKVIIGEADSEILSYEVVNENGIYSIEEVNSGQPSDFGTYATPVNGSKPLFLFEDGNGNEFISIDPYALSNTPYDGATNYKGILGFVLPSSIATNSGSYVDMNSLFGSSGYYLDTDPSITIFGLRGTSVPEPSNASLFAILISAICMLRFKTVACWEIEPSDS